MGDYFYLVAVMWTAAKLAGGAAGLVAASESGAALAFAALGGVIADRFDRRWAMVVAGIGRALAVGVLALLALRGELGMVPLVAIAMVLGIFAAVFTPSLRASVPALVNDATGDRPATDGDLQATNGLIDATRRFARALGPAMAGSLAALVSIAHFFTIDALSFVASAAAVFSLGPHFRWKGEGLRTGRGARGVFSDLGESFRLVAEHPRVAWAFAGLFVTNATWAAGFYVGAVLLASRTLGSSLAGYGFLVGAYGVGNVAGNLILGNTRIEKKTTAVFLSNLVLGAGFLVLASAPSLRVAMLGAALAAVGGPMGELPLIALLQTEFPSRQAGRVFSLHFMIDHAGFAAGLVLAAPLFAVVPIRVAIAACAVALLLTGASGLARGGRRAGDQSTRRGRRARISHGRDQLVAETTEGLGERPRVLEAVPGNGGHRPTDDDLPRRRDQLPGFVKARVGERSSAHGPRSPQPARRGRRRLADEALVEHRAEREDIAPRIDLSAALLLRRHVPRGSERRSHVRDARLFPLHTRDAEVEELHPLHRAGVVGVDRQVDVRRLEIAVHDSGRVHRHERIAHLHRDRHELRARQANLPLQARRERLAVQALHHQVGSAVDQVTVIDDFDDVGVPRQTEGLGLAPQTIRRDGVVRSSRAEELDRDR